jgi:hypothetical protein
MQEWQGSSERKISRAHNASPDKEETFVFQPEVFLLTPVLQLLKRSASQSTSSFFIGEDLPPLVDKSLPQVNAGRNVIDRKG